MNSLKPNQQAFTILELIIATTVFSVILLLVTSGIIVISKTYYKGNLQSRTQEVARNIIDEVGRDIQFSGGTIVPTTPCGSDCGGDPPYPNAAGRYGVCINGTGYSVIMDKQLIDYSATSNPATQRKQVFVKYPETDGCSPFEAITPATARMDHADKALELLAQGMHVFDFNVWQPAGFDKNTYRIDLGIGSGDLSLFATNGIGMHDRCLQTAGKEYCAISTISTVVQRRIKN